MLSISVLKWRRASRRGSVGWVCAERMCSSSARLRSASASPVRRRSWPTISSSDPSSKRFAERLNLLHGLTLASLLINGPHQLGIELAQPIGMQAGKEPHGVLALPVHETGLLSGKRRIQVHLIEIELTKCHGCLGESRASPSRLRCRTLIGVTPAEVEDEITKVVNFRMGNDSGRTQWGIDGSDVIAWPDHVTPHTLGIIGCSPDYNRNPQEREPVLPRRTPAG